MKANASAEFQEQNASAVKALDDELAKRVEAVIESSRQKFKDALNDVLKRILSHCKKKGGGSGTILSLDKAQSSLDSVYKCLAEPAQLEILEVGCQKEVDQHSKWCHDRREDVTAFRSFVPLLWPMVDNSQLDSGVVIADPALQSSARLVSVEV